MIEESNSVTTERHQGKTPAEHQEGSFARWQSSQDIFAQYRLIPKPPEGDKNHSRCSNLPVHMAVKERVEAYSFDGKPPIQTFLLKRPSFDAVLPTSYRQDGRRPIAIYPQGPIPECRSTSGNTPDAPRSPVAIRARIPFPAVPFSFLSPDNKNTVDLSNNPNFSLKNDILEKELSSFIRTFLIAVQAEPYFLNPPTKGIKKRPSYQQAVSFLTRLKPGNHVSSSYGRVITLAVVCIKIVIPYARYLFRKTGKLRAVEVWDSAL
jgi:hypothetical protein